jgi:CBS domain-containing protein
MAGDPVGIVTDRDLRRKVVAEGRDPATTPVSGIMSTPSPSRLRHTVNPGRSIPPDSSRVHGITAERGVGAPRIGEAGDARRGLPRARPVSHGIGIRSLRALAHPPLAGARHHAACPALHPDWQQFGFDDVASRMGIGILGRHTATGDALAAGEVLLALIPEIIARRLGSTVT